MNKCDVVCGSDLQRGHSGDGGLSSSIWFKYKCGMGHLFVQSWARVRRVALGSVVSEWYGVCDFVVLSVVEVCADYNNNHHHLYSHKQLHVHGVYKALSTKLKLH